tara:strand:- start:316 stop:1377 length:1062 start_codon:yes stop_codon:yes gene_type:complete
VLGLGGRSYPIIIGYDFLNLLSEICPTLANRNVVIISNKIVSDLYLPSITSSLNKANSNFVLINLPDGEQEKKLSNVEFIVSKMLEKNLDRSSIILALGGGVIGDIAGFVASIYQRGIDFIQVPTTLLAQVDSSVGGKTGVNHLLGKNMIGSFYQPKAVVIDIMTLETLNDREFSAGAAEIIKYGCIRDIRFFEWLEKNSTEIMNKSLKQLAYAIKKSCEIKSSIVEEDERESGIRALLNFGHTFGHAIESGLGYGNWLHGEAISSGMVLASHLSLKLNFLNDSEVRRIENLLLSMNLPVNPPNLDISIFIDLMRKDKKNKNNLLNYILLDGIGNSFVRSFMPEEISDFLIHV